LYVEAIKSFILMGQIMAISRRYFLKAAIGAGAGAVVGAVGQVLREEFDQGYAETLTLDQQRRNPRMTNAEIQARVEAHIDSPCSELLFAASGAVMGAVASHFIPD
jgi:hypothetical protein